MWVLKITVSIREMLLSDDKLEVVSALNYFGEMLSSVSWQLAVATRCNCAVGQVPRKRRAK